MNCKPWNPPDGGWDVMVPGGPVIIIKAPSEEDWWPDTEGLL